MNLIQLEDNDLQAQEDYINLFYDLDSDSEEGSSDKLDLYEPLQHSDLPIQHADPSMIKLEDGSSLEGSGGSSKILGTDNSLVPDLNSSEFTCTML